MNAMRLAATAVILAAVMTSGLAAKPVVLKGHTKAVTTIAWAADGTAVATAGDDRTIRVWDPATGRETVALTEIAKKGYGGPVVAFTPDLKVAAVNYWGEITLRTVADGKVLAKIDPILDGVRKSTFRPDVFAMAFSPDGKRLATAGSVAARGGTTLPGGIVVIWDAETGKVLHKSVKLATGAGAVAWSPDGKRLAAGTDGAGGELPDAGEVLVWDGETGKVQHTFKAKDMVEYGEWASAADVAFSPDGQRVAVVVKAGSRASPAGIILEDTGASIRVWDLGTGKSAVPVTGLKPSVARVVFSPDGKSLATAGADKMVRVWYAGSGRELSALACPDAVEVVALSPDGKSLAGGCKDGSVRIWEMPAAK